ncbi:hypothetical protein KSP40_PGU012675 [Platanthera guangdongensis]|uniref:F-box protein n=1 Tax=Platanthera guangdongensis TaxID=2320717 RepID=A0ABR2N3F2_9ASPA
MVRKHGLEISQPDVDPSGGLSWRMIKRRTNREVHKVGILNSGFLSRILHKLPGSEFALLARSVSSHWVTEAPTSLLIRRQPSGISASAAFRSPPCPPPPPPYLHSSVICRLEVSGLLDFGNFRMAASLFPKQKGLLTSSEILGRGSNVIFGRTWLFLSQPFSTIGLLPQFGVNAVKGAHTVDQRAMCSVVGIISRMLSAPSMTESLCQFCLKQIDLLLSVTTQRPFSSTFHRTAMSSCSFEAGRTKLISHNIGLSGRSNGHVQTISRTDICSTHKSYNFCRILSGFLHNQVAGDRNLSSHCAWSGVTGFYSNFAPCLTLWNKDLHLDSVATCSTGGAQNISFDAISQDEQLESNGVEQNRHD